MIFAHSTISLSISSAEYRACSHDGKPENWNDSRTIAIGILDEKHADCAAIMRGVWTEAAAALSGHIDHFAACNRALYHFLLRIIQQETREGSALRKHVLQLTAQGQIPDENGAHLLRFLNTRASATGSAEQRQAFLEVRAMRLTIGMSRTAIDELCTSMLGKFSRCSAAARVELGTLIDMLLEKMCQVSAQLSVAHYVCP